MVKQELGDKKMKDEMQQITIFDSSTNMSSLDYKASLDKLKDKLAKFGLTANQCKVYIYLGKYGSKTAPEVCRTLNLPRTETYHLLTTLQNRGIVKATFQHPIRFTALPLKEATWILVNAEKERVNTLESQEKDLQELWDTIPEFQKEPEEIKEDQFQMLQGQNQIQAKIKEMINGSKEEFLVLGSEKDFLKFYHSDFFEPLEKGGVDLKLLTSCSDKTMYIFDEVERNKVRKLPSEIEDNVCFLIKDNRELLFFIKNFSQAAQQVMAVWTDSYAMIHSMMLLFNNTWTKSKGIHL